MKLECGWMTQVLPMEHLAALMSGNLGALWSLGLIDWTRFQGVETWSLIEKPLPNPQEITSVNLPGLLGLQYVLNMLPIMLPIMLQSCHHKTSRNEMEQLMHCIKSLARLPSRAVEINIVSFAFICHEAPSTKTSKTVPQVEEVWNSLDPEGHGFVEVRAMFHKELIVLKKRVKAYSFLHQQVPRCSLLFLARVSNIIKNCINFLVHCTPKISGDVKVPELLRRFDVRRLPDVRFGREDVQAPSLSKLLSAFLSHPKSTVDMIF